MSRRDTIIIAVLVNAALLVVLFATAIRTDPLPTVHTMHGDMAEAPSSSQATIATSKSEAIPLDTFLDPFASSEPVDQQITDDLFLMTPTPVVTHSNENTSIDAILSPSPVQSIASTTPSDTKGPTVTVKKGDMLEKIAKANGTTVSEIMKINRLASTQLKIGQVLKIPSKDGISLTPVAKNAPLSNDTEFYVVKEGDSPWLIASKNHVKLDELLRLNQLDEQKARKLRPGDRLRIR